MPKQNSSGSKQRLGNISKQGDRYCEPSSHGRTGGDPIRKTTEPASAMAPELLERRPTKVAAIALANKIARMAWAMMARDDVTRNRPLSRPKRDHIGQGQTGVT